MNSVGLRNFTQEVMKSSVPVLVDFWSPSCGPCRALKPVLETVSNTGVKVVTLNIEDEPELAEHFKISVVPTLIVFKDGKPLKTTTGFQSKDQILQLVA